MSSLSSTKGVDYAAVARSAAFRDLVQARRRFVLTALGFASLWFGMFALFTSYAHGFMSTIIVPGLSIAYVLGISQFVMVWGATAAYLRASTNKFEPMQTAIVRAGRESELTS